MGDDLTRRGIPLRGAADDGKRLDMQCPRGPLHSLRGAPRKLLIGGRCRRGGPPRSDPRYLGISPGGFIVPLTQNFSVKGSSVLIRVKASISDIIP